MASGSNRGAVRTRYIDNDFVPSRTLDEIGPCTSDGPFPVLLFSPGMDDAAGWNTTQAEGLASQGNSGSRPGAQSDKIDRGPGRVDIEAILGEPLPGRVRWLHLGHDPRVHILQRGRRLADAIGSVAVGQLVCGNTVSGIGIHAKVTPIPVDHAMRGLDPLLRTKRTPRMRHRNILPETKVPLSRMSTTSGVPHQATLGRCDRLHKSVDVSRSENNDANLI
jgi:hypothetical protein